MSELRFFTDEHVHKAVVEELRKRGVDVVRVEDMGWKVFVIWEHEVTGDPLICAMHVKDYIDSLSMKK